MSGGVLCEMLQAGLYWVIGAVIGVGQSMQNRKRDCSRIVGRAICTGGLAMSAGAVLIWVPHLPLVGRIGVAALLATLGSAVAEKIIVELVVGVFKGRK